MTTTDMPDLVDLAAAAPDVDAFAERVMTAVLGAQEVQAAYLGDRLGWYRALAEHGPLTSAELAERTPDPGPSAPPPAAANVERYAREWLEHQAACGWVSVDDPAAEPTERRFRLPPAHAEVLAARDSLAYLTPLARFVGSVGKHLDALVDAYRRGGGVSWEQLGDEARHAQADANRTLFLHALAQELLPQAPDVHARLAGAGTIADIGCGGGWSTIALARAYPGARVEGFDIDEPSIDLARANLAAQGAEVAERVQFHVADGAGVIGEGTYDAVVAFECLHDMGDPVSVLAAMRRISRPGGLVMVMDERAEDRFTPDAGPVERLLYGYSLTCCLPDGLAHDRSVGTGTVMRTGTLRRYARAAGFAEVEVLPIEHDTFRFYRLR